MAMRTTKEPRNVDDDDENFYIKAAKRLIPFFLFFVLALALGDAWNSWDWGIRAAVVATIVFIAFILYREEFGL